VVWVWDNLNVHLVDELALFLVENEQWLTCSSIVVRS